MLCINAALIFQLGFKG
uniref:Uncharacterized protein n=1 Tax=Rhizophora mucronata TaxID=61149 RepID=A0A2P2Q9U0_RHIMU